MSDRTRTKKRKGLSRERRSNKLTAAEPTMAAALRDTRKEEPYARPITVTKKETRDE